MKFVCRCLKTKLEICLQLCSLYIILLPTLPLSNEILIFLMHNLDSGKRKRQMKIDHQIMIETVQSFINVKSKLSKFE